MIKVAIRQFEQKMEELSEDWDTEKLTVQLAQQVSQALKEAFSAAATAAFRDFVKSDQRQLFLPSGTVKFDFAPMFLAPFDNKKLHSNQKEPHTQQNSQ